MYEFVVYANARYGEFPVDDAKTILGILKGRYDSLSADAKMELDKVIRDDIKELKRLTEGTDDDFGFKDLG